MKIIYVPTVSVNENEVKLVSWKKKQGDLVKNGDIICELETSKSTYDVEADKSGYLYFELNEDIMVTVGAPLAIISENVEKDFSQIFKTITSTTKEKEAPGKDPKKRFTKKAELIAQKAGINVEEIELDSTLITEDILLKYIESKREFGPHGSVKRDVASSAIIEDLVDSIHTTNRQERVLILGAGGGCNLVLDILSRQSSQRGVLILDSNKALHNKTMMGITVLGSIDLIEELWEQRKFDAVISTIVKDNNERKEIFDAVNSKGIPFTNIIDTSANIRSNVKMGTGNLIVSGCYLAPSVTIGDNNFLAAYTAIEHHSTIGSHCTFGPRFTASGKVNIGDGCKFGMGIFVEPFVTIGSNTTIASGAILTGHVPENSIVKTENRLHIKSKLK